MRRATCRCPRSPLSAPPAHLSVHADLPEHLARTTAAADGLAEPPKRRHRTTDFDLPHRSPEFLQERADMVNRSPGTTFTLKRKCMPGERAAPKHTAELPLRMAA